MQYKCVSKPDLCNSGKRRKRKETRDGGIIVHDSSILATSAPSFAFSASPAGDLARDPMSAGMDFATGGDEAADGGEATSSAPSPDGSRLASAL